MQQTTFSISEHWNTIIIIFSLYIYIQIWIHFGILVNITYNSSTIRTRTRTRNDSKRKKLKLKYHQIENGKVLQSIYVSTMSSNIIYCTVYCTENKDYSKDMRSKCGASSIQYVILSVFYYRISTWNQFTSLMITHFIVLYLFTTIHNVYQLLKSIQFTIYKIIYHWI